MAARRVMPEILDRLSPTDPEAIRSRRDLRRINGMMGNVRWVDRCARDWPGHWRVVEIGAGEGLVSRRLQKRTGVFTAVDLAPAPAGLEKVWRRGDLFQILPEVPAEVLVGVMIVHHFSDEQLAALGQLVQGYRAVCLCEPWRAVVPAVWGWLLRPLVGRVTRHDMPVSQQAGFQAGELAGLLGLKSWRWRERCDWRGSLRFEAWRE